MFSTYNNAVLIEPPKKIIKSNYVCSNKFNLDSILEMYKEDRIFGIILANGSGYVMSLVKKAGNHVEFKILSKSSVTLQKRQKKGGSSSARIGRLRDEKETSYIRSLVERMREVYEDGGLIEGLILGGNAEIKKKIRKENIYQQWFEKLTLKMVTVENVNESSILEIYENNIDIFSENQEIIGRIKNMIDRADDKLAIGLDEVTENLKDGMLESAILYKEVPENIINGIKDLAKNVGCEVIEIDVSVMNIDVMGIKWY